MGTEDKTVNDKLEQKIIESFIDAAFGVLWYNYDNTYMCKTIKQIIRLINYERIEENEEAAFIYQELVLMFGDYGVSPRRGWIDEKYKNQILAAIDKYCHDMRIDLENEKVEEYE